MKPRTKSITIINLLDVIMEAEETACDGDPIWDEMIDHESGRQRFSNDIIFRYTLPSINGEELSPVQQRIVDLCGDAIEDDTIYFDVCW